MDFPELRDGQHAVITAEVSTGIVLRLAGQRRLGGKGETWRVFDSLAAAHEFAIAKVAKRPAVECGIYDAQQRSVEIVRHEDVASSD
jgi:hypothetical protein